MSSVERSRIDTEKNFLDVLDKVQELSSDEVDDGTLKSRTFYGREKDNAVYPIALANLALHAIDEPKIWHGNALTGVPSYNDLFAGAPEFFDVVIMTPPSAEKKAPSPRRALTTRRVRPKCCSCRTC